jgi:hypothetical protein
MKNSNDFRFRYSRCTNGTIRLAAYFIWIHVGRWWNEATGLHGSAPHVSIETLAISEWTTQVECLISKPTGVGRSAIR